MIAEKTVQTLASAAALPLASAARPLVLLMAILAALLLIEGRSIAQEQRRQDDE